MDTLYYGKGRRKKKKNHGTSLAVTLASALQPEATCFEKRSVSVAQLCRRPGSEEQHSTLFSTRSALAKQNKSEAHSVRCSCFQSFAQHVWNNNDILIILISMQPAKTCSCATFGYFFKHPCILCKQANIQPLSFLSVFSPLDSLLPPLDSLQSSIMAEAREEWL